MKSSFQYSYTVTLQPRLYSGAATQQYDMTYLVLYKLLKGLTQSCTLVAEMTKSYNIHYHGICTFSLQGKGNPSKRFVDAFRGLKMFGFVNIKQIDDLQGWIDYIIKDLHITKNDINRPPIICNEHGILPYDGIDAYMQQDLSDDC